MALVESPSRVRDPVFTPWVRVVRQEASRHERAAGYRWHVIDVVHAAFFERYIIEHVDPFLSDFANRVRHLSEALRNPTGGQVETLDEWSWSHITPYKGEGRVPREDQH
jgi:hypothetical protein